MVGGSNKVSRTNWCICERMVGDPVEHDNIKSLKRALPIFLNYMETLMGAVSSE